MRGERVVIVGAGIGGLTAAVLLAARGLDVTVIEKLPAPGGKMRQLSPAGRPIDAGPTVFTMRWVFDEIFAAAGAEFGSEVMLSPLSILARHAWGDAATLDLNADRATSIDAISRFSGTEEGRRFSDFCDQAEKTYRTLERPFLRGTKTNPIGLTSRIGLPNIADMASIRPFSTLWRVLGRHFHDPRLRQLFGRYATYSGASPFQAPATLMLIAHVEQSGVWSVEGGMHAVAKAFATLAERRGAKLHYGRGCAAIDIRNGKVAGVRLEDGTSLPADAIVANCDPSAIGAGLFGADVAGAVKAIRPNQRSLSALCWVADLPTSGFSLSRHNVFFSDDYAAEFTNLRSDRLPDDPTVYVCAQDRDQRDSVAEGAPERLQIIVNAPANGDTRPLAREEIVACQTRMFDRLARCGLKMDRKSEPIQLTTPAGFNQLFPATGGALYGRATHGWAAAFRRPGARTPIQGLYLAGGATHPGAGVPMAALSGCRAAESLIADLSSTLASHPVATAGGMSMPSAKTGATG
jgi:1-hydroxycarotenoid 3,4-desaturase